MKLIDKNKFLEELKKLKQNLSASPIIVIEDVESLVESLEVKEIDIDKYYIDFLQREWFGKHCNRTMSEMMNFTAKHFFELGFQARTDKELIEEVYSHLDSIKDITERMTSGNFMHNKAAIKFSADTIAKVLELMGIKKQKGE